MNTFFLRLLAITLGAGIGLAACGNDPAPEVDAMSSDLDGAVSVPNPSGAYSAAVIASGAGCAPGTWDAEIGPDGHDLTLRFHAYQVEVKPGVKFAVSSCVLEIDFSSEEPLSLAVSQFHYDGHATLAHGQSAAATLHKYYFAGNPVPAMELRADMQGPSDQDFVYEDDRGSADWVWSPCGTKRRLLDGTRLVLQNDPQSTGTGALDRAGDLTARFRIEWRSC